MGHSNLRHSLSKRYSALTGQLREVQSNIARIKREAEKLPELEAETRRLETLIASAAMVLQDADPNWRAEDAPPIKPFVHMIPVPFGSCGRRALAVLRNADKPMTAREVALEVLRQAGSEDAEPKMIRRTVNAVEASLRHHRGRTVESSGKYPAQWRTIAKQDLEFDP